MNGLLRELKIAEARLSMAREDMRLDASPQDAHDASLRATALEKEIGRLNAMIADDHVILAQLEAAMLRLRNPEFATPHRMLVYRHLEDSESRILRELGN